MEMTFEAPISADDVKVTEDRQAVTLRREKFSELVQYVEHLEGALRGADFEFQQERRFAGFLLGALHDSLRAMDDQGHARVCRALALRWREEAQRLYEEGVVRRESADVIIERLAGMIEVAETGSGAGHGQ